MKYVYNVGFITNEGKPDETQIDIPETVAAEETIVEIVNLILSLKNELNLKEVTYIDYLGENEEDEE